MAQVVPSIPSLVSFLPDAVAVYTQDYQQVFKNARPIRASVRPSSKLMEHPLETGATIADHRIILPTEIDLVLIATTVDYYNTYQTIQQLFNEGILLIVQTRASVYFNQVLQEIPHEETPERFNTIQIALRLKEAQYAPPSVSTVIPRDQTNTDAVNRGTQQAAPPADDGVYNSIFSRIFS